MSLGKKVFSSAVLLFVRKIWGNAINLIVMAFLARILSKDDFGLLAVSSVLLGIINTLATSGISEYIIYYSGEEKEQKVNAAFWLNLFLTIGVISIVVIIGPFWAEFFGNDKIYPLILLLLVSFFFEMLLSIPKSLLRKDLEYKTLVLYGSIAMTLVSLGKLLAAIMGFGVYSLALPQAIVSPLLLLVLSFKIKWRPSIKFDYNNFKVIYKYTRHVVGGRILTKLVNEGDNLIVGKFIGLEALGIYTLAFQLANLVTTNVVFVVNDIFLPLLSKVKHEIERLRYVYSSMINFISFISFPIITSIAISAEGIVYFVYGQKWMDAVLPFQILCVFALVRSLSSPSSALFSAVGRPDIGFKFTLIFTPIFLAALFFGSQNGVVGAALATTLTRVIGSLVSLSLSLSLIDLTLMSLISSLRNNILAALFIIFLSLLIYFYIMDYNGHLLVFIFPVFIYLNLMFQRLFYPKRILYLFDLIERFTSYSRINVLLRKLFFFNESNRWS